MQPAAIPSYLPFVIAPLFVFAIYRRLRSHFGRQVWRPRMARARLVMVSLLLCVILVASTTRPDGAWMLAVAAVIGALLALFSLRLMHVELVDAQPTYIPNPWIGGVLSALLVGRLAWRFVELRSGGPHAPAATALTFAFATALLVFYTVQGVGLTRRMRRLTAVVAPT